MKYSLSKYLFALGIVFSQLFSFGQIDVARVKQGKSYNYTIIINSDSIKRANDIKYVSPSKYRESVTFSDYYGRTSITTSFDVKGTKDLVKVYKYDKYGNSSKNYLPFVAETDKGFLDNPLPVQLNYYLSNQDCISTEAKPYSITEYEKSILRRVQSVTPAGNDWHENNKKTTYEYSVNAGEMIRKFIPSSTPGEYTASGYYSAGELRVVKAISPDGIKTTEYFDSNDRKILSDQDGFKTYYLYDNLGHLEYILPPKAVDQLSSINYTITASNTFIKSLCYRNVYDANNRLVVKYAPGADPVEFVYDRLFRPIMTRDGQMRKNGKWKFIKYDIFERMIYWGLKSSLDSRQALQDLADNKFTYNEIQTGNTTYTLDKAFPSVNTNEILEYFIYDKYAPSALRASELTALGMATTDTASALGLTTYTKTKVLDTDKWIENWFFYNSEGRLIQSVMKNGLDKNSMQYSTQKYSYEGQVSESRFTYSLAGSDKLTLKYFYDYTALGQIKSIDAEILNGGLGRTQIAAYEYNALGKLVKRKIGKNGDSFLQVVDYFYSAQGSLTGINRDMDSNDLFSLKLHFQDNFGYLGAKKRYDGQISAIEFFVKRKSPNIDPGLMGFSYNYDNHNRLTSAKYGAGAGFNNNVDRYNESFTYDSNGNITKLGRKGKVSDQTGILDSLSYTYDGNQVSNISKVAGSLINLQNFVDKEGTGKEYTYDLNGNMVTDANKGINTTVYNVFNSPTSIQVVKDGSTNHYQFLYSASGEKLRAIYGNDTISYSGILTFKNRELRSIAIPEGRINCTGFGPYTPEYQISDHQGSVRVTFVKGANGQADLTSSAHYYPSGLEIADFRFFDNPVNRFGYGGKEETNSPLNWLDFHARWYDPVIARWHAVDPLAEQTAYESPYLYCAGNPINLIDPTGMQSVAYFDLWESVKQKGDITNNVLPGGNRIVQFTDIGAPRFGSQGFRSDGDGNVVDNATGQSMSVEEAGTKLNSGEIKSEAVKKQLANAIEDAKIRIKKNAEKAANKKKLVSKSEGGGNRIWAGALTATGVLVADDATGVGVADDVAIPVIWAVAATIYLYERIAGKDGFHTSIGTPFNYVSPQPDNQNDYYNNNSRPGLWLAVGVTIIMGLDLTQQFFDTTTPTPITPPAPTNTNKDTTTIIIPYRPGYGPR